MKDKGTVCLCDSGLNSQVSLYVHISGGMVSCVNSIKRALYGTELSGLNSQVSLCVACLCSCST